MKADVKLSCSLGPQTVAGEVLGTFAVVFYPDDRQPDRPYSVAHVASGLAAARTRTKKHALHIARRFRDLPMDWTSTSGKFDPSSVSSRILRLIKSIRKEARQA